MICTLYIMNGMLPCEVVYTQGFTGQNIVLFSGLFKQTAFNTLDTPAPSTQNEPPNTTTQTHVAAPTGSSDDASTPACIPASPNTPDTAHSIQNEPPNTTTQTHVAAPTGSSNDAQTPACIPMSSKEYLFKKTGKEDDILAGVMSGVNHLL